MNNYTKAAVWARLMAAALTNPENARDVPHLADYVARAARAADFALAEYVKRHDRRDVQTKGS